MWGWVRGSGRVLGQVQIRYKGVTPDTRIRYGVCRSDSVDTVDTCRHAVLKDFFVHVMLPNCCLFDGAYVVFGLVLEGLFLFFCFWALDGL